ncbi:ctl [Cryptophlebia peltastica nucleopolyhedrovirus]|uniref:Ctl n=1 Tax=Cryptophlebia peltastica nucleopolyhedrovirus TaxID=2304025 RepID=A0A346RNR7_9ABAC|nr:ctl [Cryptophlebia peltastica nucleopolyhedrovirus]AXS67714.1 ctl [Cryptophlebia peltastica nucleopolyhedrovirus]
MRLKTTLIILMACVAYAMACVETGRNCNRNDQCCSGACSAAFGFCLHR